MTLNHQRRIVACARIARHLKRAQELATNLTDMYQFGVFTGGGLKAWLQSMPRFNLTFHGDIWGFDSFEGMPHENPSNMTSKHRRDPMWQMGGLNAASVLNTPSWSELQAVLTRNIGHGAGRTHFIRGFFNNSLANAADLARRKGMRAAFLVDLDADLYTSTKQALRFVLDASLLVAGSFLHYDDMSDYQGLVTAQQVRKQQRLTNTTAVPTHLEDGTQVPEVLRAHLEVNDEYGLTWQQLRPFGNYPGPVEGLEWIRQTPVQHRGKWLPPEFYSPVFQLLNCARCPVASRFPARGLCRGEPKLVRSKSGQSTCVPGVSYGCSGDNSSLWVSDECALVVFELRA